MRLLEFTDFFDVGRGSLRNLWLDWGKLSYLHSMGNYLLLVPVL